MLKIRSYIVRISAEITVRLIGWQLRNARIDWVAPDGTAIESNGRLERAFYDLDADGLAFPIVVQFASGQMLPGESSRLRVMRRIFDYRRLRNVAAGHYQIED